MSPISQSANPRTRRDLAHFELVVTANPDAPHRIVRVVSSVPYTLSSLRIGSPRSGIRHMKVSVFGDATSLETLRKRLDRLVDVLKVRVTS